MSALHPACEDCEHDSAHTRQRASTSDAGERMLLDESNRECGFAPDYCFGDI